MKAKFIAPVPAFAVEVCNVDWNSPLGAPSLRLLYVLVLVVGATSPVRFKPGIDVPVAVIPDQLGPPSVAATVAAPVLTR